MIFWFIVETVYTCQSNIFRSRRLSLKILKRRLSWIRHREVADNGDDGGNSTELADTPTIEENGSIQYHCELKWFYLQNDNYIQLAELGFNVLFNSYS